MKVYIASVFADKNRVKTRCEELNALGIETTSRWASEDAAPNSKVGDKSMDYMRETAVTDVDDIVAADKLVLTVPSLAEMVNLTAHQLGRGGRHFESGMIYGLILAEALAWGLNEGCLKYRTDNPLPQVRELILMGNRENVFHFLDGLGAAAKYPTIRQVETWDEVKAYLVAVERRVIVREDTENA